MALNPRDFSLRTISNAAVLHATPAGEFIVVLRKARRCKGFPFRKSSRPLSLTSRNPNPKGSCASMRRPDTSRSSMRHTYRLCGVCTSHIFASFHSAVNEALPPASVTTLPLLNTFTGSCILAASKTLATSLTCDPASTPPIDDTNFILPPATSHSTVESDM